MSDRYDRNTNERVGSPAWDALAVTPHDTTKLATYSKALFVGTGGNVAVLTVAGNTVTFTNVQDGQILPIRVQRVNSTSTTASNIVAFI